MSDTYQQVLMESRAEWRQWLTDHHQDTPGIWLVTWKKDSGHPQLPYNDIVEEALCFGWIDSRPRSIGADRSALLVTPRKPTSNWSRSNKQRVASLTAAGLMHPAGLAAVAAAKANGSWDALEHVEDLTEPEDLTAALDATPTARQNWDAFPRSTRRAILEWIGNAKTNATRQARIGRTARGAAINIRANQWRQPKGSRPQPQAPLRCAERERTARAILSAGRCRARRMLRAGLPARSRRGR